MTWKLVAFDWDGTLVDTTQIAYEAVRTIFNHYGVEAPTKEVYLENITTGDMLAFYHDRGIPRRATLPDLKAIWQQYFQDPKRNNDSVLLREGAREALAACRMAGINTSIVSGSMRNIIVAGLTTLGLSDLIDHIEADAIGKVEELRRVVNRFSVRPKDVVYVDDTFEGLSAAKNVGIMTIGIVGGFTPRARLLEANPDYLISSLNELLPLFGMDRAEQ